MRRAGAIRSLSADELSVGDAILVAPGGRIPVDGTVLSGHSFVDESRITGKSLPAEKVADTQVFAGSINQSGALEICAEKIGRDTSYGKIIEAVERAERSRAPVQRLADRLAGYLVYFALGAAVLTFLITRNINATISVVIVAGACGIAAGTPLAILGGIGRSARLGAIVKGGVHLENSRPRRYRCPRQDRHADLRPAGGSASLPDRGCGERGPAGCGGDGRAAVRAPARQGDRRLCRRVKAAAFLSRRPSPTRQAAASPPKARERPFWSATRLGWRITASRSRSPRRNPAEPARRSSSPAADACSARSIVADTVRPEAKRAIEALDRMGVRTILLTGDAKRVAAAVASSLGIKEVEAELLPEDKLARIQALVAQKRLVAMVGDGVNDAPALAEAHVGVAMGSGTDVAQESADVVLLGNDLERFVETLAVARRTRGIIWQNFAGTIGVDTLGIVLAALGFLNPLLAAAIHVVSELVFILNSARLLPTAEKAIKALPEPSAEARPA